MKTFSQEVKQLVKLTWYSNGPLLTQEGVTGQWRDANTCHVGCSHLKLVLPVLLQVRHLKTKPLLEMVLFIFKTRINSSFGLSTIFHIYSLCRPSHWQPWCWPRATSPARHQWPHGNPQSSRWCQPRQWRLAVSRQAPWSRAHTPGWWCHRVEQGRLRWRKTQINTTVPQ